MLHRYKAKHMSNIRVFTAALDAALDELFAHDQVSALEYMSDAADDLNSENSNSSQEERTAVSFLNKNSSSSSREERTAVSFLNTGRSNSSREERTAVSFLNTDSSNSIREEHIAVSFLNTGSRNCSRKEQPYKWTQLKYFAIELLSAKSTEAMFL